MTAIGAATTTTLTTPPPFAAFGVDGDTSFAAAAQVAPPAAATTPAASTQAGAGAAALNPGAAGSEVRALLLQLVSVLQSLLAQTQAASGAATLGGGAAPGQSPIQAAVPPVTAVPGGGAPALHGSFQAGAKPTTGSASVVATPGGGQALQLTRLQTAPGPDLHVYLSPKAGDPTGSDHVDLGPLKSSTGDQQLAIPPGTDLGRYSTAVIWCAQAKVAFGSAPLAG